MIRRHIAYGKYVIRHRWYVMIACFSKGLIWRGLVHDLSKFRPSEWFPYAWHFYGPDSHHKDGSHIARGGTEDKAFDFAWLLHQKRNRHHWQWWMLPEDDGAVKLIEMPIRYVKEMICDWIGAGRAQGVKNWQDPSPWYRLNKGKIQLAPTTRWLLEDRFFHRRRK